MARIETRIKVPEKRYPKLPGAPRNPRGWNTTEISIKSEGAPYARNLRQRYPAGAAPEWWTGSQPEWSVYWGLLKNGQREGIDFIYRARVPGVGLSYYSEIDFLIPFDFIGIEVQGQYWHYAQGSHKMYLDQMRVLAFANAGITVVFIDETDADEDPIYYVREALSGVDHSMATTQGGL